MPSFRLVYRFHLNDTTMNYTEAGLGMFHGTGAPQKRPPHKDKNELMQHANMSKNHWSNKQGHNHVFKVGGPIPWSMVLLRVYRKTIDRSAQFGAVSYIITLYSSKSYVKSWVVRKMLGRSGPPRPSPVISPIVINKKRVLCCSAPPPAHVSTVQGCLLWQTVCLWRQSSN